MKLKVNTIYIGTADISEYLIVAQNFFKQYDFDLEFSANHSWKHIDLTVLPEIAGGSANIKTKYDGAYKIRVGLKQDYMPNGQPIWRDVGQILIHEILHCFWAEMGLGDIHDKNLGIRDNVQVMEAAAKTVSNFPDKIIVHHSAGTQGYDIIKAEHILNGWGDIAYHFIIEQDGIIKVGRWEVKEGTHTIGKNNSSIGICMIGNFSETLPANEQINSLKILLDEYKQLKSYPHRHFKPENKTECYGLKLADSWSENLRTNMTVDFALLSKLYTAIFHRNIDEAAKDYAGKDIDFVLNELMGSDEWKWYDPVIKAVKGVEENL